MKKISQKIIAAAFMVMATTSFAQSRSVPTIVAIYAENLVNVEVCKLHKIAITPMDQRKVIKEYIERTGSQKHFVEDVRSYTGTQMDIMGSLSKDQQMELCAAKASIDKEIAAILAPKKPQEPVNPLDAN